VTKAGILREKERGSLEEMQYSAFTDTLCHKIMKPHISVISSFRMTFDTPVTFMYMYLVHITARTSLYHATLLSSALFA